MTNIEKNYMILGYNNRESVAMAAILNKRFSSAVIFGEFSPGCLVGIQVTVLEISAFYIFSGLNPNAPGLIRLAHIISYAVNTGNKNTYREQRKLLYL